MKNIIKILVFFLVFSISYAQVKETTIKVEIGNAQTSDKKAVKRNIEAKTKLRIKTKTTAQTDTVYLSIPVEPTTGNKSYYKVKMIIETPAADEPTEKDTIITVPIKGLEWKEN